MSVAFHPDFGQQIRYSIDPLPEDPHGQVRVTMSRLRRLLRMDSQDPWFQQHAQVIRTASQDPIKAVWDHCKQMMRFQSDEETAKRLETKDTRKEDAIEVLIRPIDQALLIQLRGIGVEDCDGYELYAGCLLTALGVPASLVTVSADEDEPSRFSHVYLAAYPMGYDKRPRIPLDFSHGDYPGWECPNTGRMKEWPIHYTVSEAFWDGLFPIGILAGIYFGVKYFEKREEAA